MYPSRCTYEVEVVVESGLQYAQDGVFGERSADVNQIVQPGQSAAAASAAAAASRARRRRLPTAPILTVIQHAISCSDTH